MIHPMQSARGLRTLAAALALAFVAAPALAQDKIKVGLMLPYTGTFAALGNAITNGFKLAVSEQGGKLGGREIEYVTVDDESDPAKAPENANKLIKRDKVDVIVGTVHSGVAMALAKAAKDNNALLIVPNAGADEITGPMCAPNIFRTSFSNSSPGYAMGKVAAERGHKSVVTLTWKYAAGDQSVNGFKEAFEKGGGKVTKQLSLPFPNVEFQPFLTEIAALKPDAVYVFFAGGGAVKFVKDYDAAGLQEVDPAVRGGIPHRRDARGAGRVGGGPADDAALRRPAGQSEEQRLPRRVQEGLQRRARRLRDAGLRLRPAAGRGHEGGRRRHGQARRADQGDADGEDRQPARPVLAVQGQQPGAGLLPAAGRGQGEQGDRRRDQGLRGSGDRLQDVGCGIRVPVPAAAGRGGESRHRAPPFHVAGDFAGGAGHAHDRPHAMDISIFLIQLLNALQYGLLLFLVASGLTLIFGIMGIINLAHGSFYMIGAYMAFSLSSLTGSLAVAMVLGVVLSVILGLFLEWALFSHLYRRDHLEQVLLTYGLILIFEELRSLIVGNDVHGVPVPADARRLDRARRHDDLSGLPAGDVGGVPRHRARHVPAHPEARGSA